MKKTKIMISVYVKDSIEKNLKEVDAWETGLNGLYITRARHNDFSFTHEKSGLSIYGGKIKTIKYGRTIAKEELYKIDWTKDEEYIKTKENIIKEVYDKYFAKISNIKKAYGNYFSKNSLSDLI